MIQQRLPDLVLRVLAVAAPAEQVAAAQREGAAGVAVGVAADAALEAGTCITVRKSHWKYFRLSNEFRSQMKYY